MGSLKRDHSLNPIFNTFCIEIINFGNRSALLALLKIELNQFEAVYLADFLNISWQKVFLKACKISINSIQ